MNDRVLIVDFGSQVTQLIARRVRESGVYCEIVPFNRAAEMLVDFAPRAVILSGGPASVTAGEAPRAPDALFEMGVPVLGICYGQQLMCAQLGGAVEASEQREFGRAFVEVGDDCGLFDGVWQKGAREQVWMSHGDRVTKLPEGFRAVAQSEGAPLPPSPTTGAGSTACSSTRKWCTRRTARPCWKTSRTRWRAAPATGP